MALQPRLQDVLHLVMWNGYTEDCRQAVYTSKETYTDERVWYPFLIQHGHGPKKKVLPQIIAEHCTYVESPQTRKLVPRKGGMLVYKPEGQWLRRMDELYQMAVDSYNTRIFEATLGKTDNDGNSILISACKTNCPNIVSYLLKRGHHYNQENNLGGSPQYYAFNSKFGQRAWNSLLDNSKFKSKYKQPRYVPVAPVAPVAPIVPLAPVAPIVPLAHNVPLAYRLNIWANFQDDEIEPEPPKKRLKRSEYKKQFGR